MFDTDEVAEWEQAALEATVRRAYKTEKSMKCPRREKMKDYRHHRESGSYLCKESKWVRKSTNRKFRRKLRQADNGEDTVIPVPHDYKTYGWLTW